MDDEPLRVAEFVDYCRTQAGLLSGTVQTLGDEADAMLDELDEEAAELRARLDGAADGPGGTASPTGAAPAGPGVDVDAVEEQEADLAARQALVEAKQARMRAYQELAAGYADLAEALASEVEDGTEALERVVAFEADHDAPAYFDERRTVLEAAVSGAGDDDGGGADDSPDDDDGAGGDDTGGVVDSDG